MLIGVGFLGFCLIYQLCFRYEYYHYGGNIARIDRLTGAVCAVPCTSTPAPQSLTAVPQTPRPTLDEVNKIISTETYKRALDELNAERLQDAIAIAKRDPDVPQHDASYEWRNDLSSKGLTKEGLALMEEEPFPLSGDPDSDADTFFIVCLCDSHGAGWRWEVNTRFRRARFINDNAILRAKYGL